MRRLTLARHLLLVAALLAAGPAAAAQATQDWPCIQPRQPRLSVGQMWSGPAPDAATEAMARDDAEIAALADRLAQRRLAPQDVPPLLAPLDHDPQRLTAVFLATFQRIEAERERLLDGVARYGLGQAELAAQIEGRYARLAELQAAEAPDPDALREEKRKRDWDTRIFEERRQMLTAVCESPVLLEKRLFELARIIQAEL